MMINRFAQTTLLALGFTLATTAMGQAQAVCGARDAILNRLSSQFGETRRSMGLGANNGIVEVFASAETGTWTITMTLPDGRMCLVASGESFEDEMDPLKASDTAL